MTPMELLVELCCKVLIYVNEVHGTLVGVIGQAVSELADRAMVYESGFTEIDGSDDAHITQESLEEVQKRVEGNMEAFAGEVGSLSDILYSVSDLFASALPSTESVSNNYDAIRETTTNLNQSTGSYEASHLGDCANINGMLESVLSIISAQSAGTISVNNYSAGKIANLDAFRTLQESYGASVQYYSDNMQQIADAHENIASKIEAEIEELAKELQLANIKIIPVSATEGDNVAHTTDTMKWYTGESLLSYLENVEVSENSEEKGFYLPVQRVCRPDHTFRGFQGQIESGNISEGDEITVVPGGEKARINSIYVGDKKERSAVKGEAVTLQLDREIDISRGSVIVKDAGIETADSLTATILWMDDTPLHNGINYFVKLGTSLIPGIVTKILYTIDVNTGKFRETDVVQKNEIAVCRISLTDRISIAKFKDHKTLGELILIDRISFATSACGVVEQYEKNGGLIGDNVTKDTRSSVLGQKAVTILFKSSQGISKALLEKVEKKLILGGRHTYLLEADENVKENELPVIIKHLNEAGIVVLLLTHNDNQIQALLDSKSEVTSY